MKVKTERPVDQYDKAGNHIQSFRSVKEAGKQFNIPNCEQNISMAARGVSKSAYGFVWIYTPYPIEVDETFKKHPSLPIDVSNYGTIRTKKCCGTKGFLNGDGYRKVKVNKSNYFVHRLVAETWIGDIPKNFVVDHMLDENGNLSRENNNVKYLQIVSHRENNQLRSKRNKK
jgi:hypothetical protein